MNLKNKKSGFWRRFGARGIDLTIIGTIVVLISIMFIDMDKLEFRETWMFYMWIIMFAITLATFGLIIPAKFNGKTIGSFVFKIQVVSEDKITAVMVRREFFFTIAWLFMLFLVGTIINHTLIIDYLRTDRPLLTEWETFRITIITTFGGLIAFIQLTLGITLLASNDNESFHDKTSNSNVIIVDQFVKEKKERKPIKPIEIKNESQYEWVEQE